MKLAAFTILVPDYDAGIAFYCTGLGFSLIEDIDQGPKRWISIAPQPGGVRIILARADTAAQIATIGQQGGGRVWLFLHTEDFQRDHERIQAAGGVFEERPRHEPYGTVAVWRDPFGNRWDLIAPRPQEPQRQTPPLSSRP